MIPPFIRGFGKKVVHHAAQVKGQMQSLHSDVQSPGRGHKIPLACPESMCYVLSNFVTDLGLERVHTTHLNDLMMTRNNA